MLSVATFVAWGTWLCQWFQGAYNRLYSLKSHKEVCSCRQLLLQFGVPQRSVQLSVATSILRSSAKTFRASMATSVDWGRIKTFESIHTKNSHKEFRFRILIKKY